MAHAFWRKPALMQIQSQSENYIRSLMRPALAFGDRWLLWPTYATMALTMCASLVCGLPGLASFLLVPIVILGWPLIAGAMLVVAVALASIRCIRMSASVCVAVLLPVALLAPINWAMDCLHLGMTVGLGLGRLHFASFPAASRFTVYDWSIGFAGGINTFLIRDATDEIALPPSRQTGPIVGEADFNEQCAGRVRHLLGHYYVCNF